MKVDYKIDLVGLKTKKQNTYLTRKYPHIALSRLIYLGAVQFFQHIFSGQNRRAWKFTRHIPTSIQILSDQIASVIAQKHTVRINHRDYFEYEILTQNICYRMAAQDKLQESFKKKG